MLIHFSNFVVAILLRLGTMHAFSYSDECTMTPFRFGLVQVMVISLRQVTDDEAVQKLDNNN